MKCSLPSFFKISFILSILILIFLSKSLSIKILSNLISEIGLILTSISYPYPYFSLIWPAFPKQTNSPFITDHINLLASGSIPVDGSSKSTIGGLHKNEIATVNLRLLPPDKRPAILFVNSPKDISSIIDITTLCKYSGLIPLILP